MVIFAVINVEQDTRKLFRLRRQQRGLCSVAMLLSRLLHLIYTVIGGYIAYLRSCNIQNGPHALFCFRHNTSQTSKSPWARCPPFALDLCRDRERERDGERAGEENASREKKKKKKNTMISSRCASNATYDGLTSLKPGALYNFQCYKMVP